MTNKTLKALKGSIKKWDDIVNSKGIDRGKHNCPLCNLYWDRDCDGCPVSTKTKETTCGKTPYESWDKHFDKHHFYPSFSKRILCPECKKLAKKEFAFLKSLLPKEQKNGRSNSME